MHAAVRSNMAFDGVTLEEPTAAGDNWSTLLVLFIGEGGETLVVGHLVPEELLHDEPGEDANRDPVIDSLHRGPPSALLVPLNVPCYANHCLMISGARK